MIRDATLSDVEAISQVHVASWRQAYRGILPADFLASLSIEQRQAGWVDSISKNRPQVLVAEVNGAVVGFSSFDKCRDEHESSTAYEIWSFYLAPNFWSMGLGRELWIASRAAMLVSGATMVSLWVLADNARAIKFYRAAGFLPDLGSIKQIQIGGIELSEVRYIQRFLDPLI